MFLNSEVKKKFLAVSYSDLWIYAACVAIEEMGGEKATLAAICLDKFEQMLMVRKVTWGLPHAQTSDQ
jgi:catalase (peroxidase I)